MNVLPFIPKQDQELPDTYTIKFFFHDGRASLDLEVAQHRIICGDAVFEYVTKDDIWGLVPLTSIKRMEFDKNFSRVMACRAKHKVKIVGAKPPDSPEETKQGD